MIVLIACDELVRELMVYVWTYDFVGLRWIAFWDFIGVLGFDFGVICLFCGRCG